jgi:hypothetical protein
MIPAIFKENDTWIIVARVLRSDRAGGDQYDWCWTREGWAPATGTALKFETPRMAREYLRENQHLLRSSAPPP